MTYQPGEGKVPLKDRFWSRVETEGKSDDDCWYWTRSVNKSGYGGIGLSAVKKEEAHRVAYRFAHDGQIPDGLSIDHVCHNTDPECAGGPSCMHRRCCNPRHLEAIPLILNVQRGRLSQVLGRHWAKREACSAGHAYVEGSFYIKNDKRGGSYRVCRRCMVHYQREYQKRKREKA